MIPKIIHYCWFGGNPLPALTQECIASWRKYLPDYEIWEWREEASLPALPNRESASPKRETLADKVMGFDVDSIPYTAEAYRQKKYAFVSDYARFYIIYKYGGIYFDTDVEVIGGPSRPPQGEESDTPLGLPVLDGLPMSGFMGFEQDPDGENTPGRYAPRYCFAINPGLGFGMTKEHPFMKQMMEHYHGLKFEPIPNGDIAWYKTIVAYTTEKLMEQKPPLTPPKGENFRMSGWFKQSRYGEIQMVGDGIYVYPSEYFAPINAISGRLHITENTRTIHRYAGSWINGGSKSWKNIIRHYIPEWLYFLNNRLKRRKYRVCED